MKAHEYGEFSHRPGRNIFTLSDIQTSTNSESQECTFSSHTVSGGSSRFLFLSAPSALWVVLGLLATLSSCCILESGYHSVPVLIVALVVQIVLAVVSVVCLIIKHRKAIASNFCN